MKGLTRLSIALFLSTAFLFSCDDEDDKTELSITNIEAKNHDAEGVEVKHGGTIELNFTAIAGDEARLDYYHIELHDHPESGKIEDEYRIIDESFKDKATFKGLRNADVHQHITVPDEANLGEYHVVIVVVDEDGNSVDTEDGDDHIIVVE
ncbi:DUF4625 domain-containing protein [Reichenbachiella versicolor]|uniref:DUF4625 domain-containing protein n=1 Tax=Reichenbachiella versicolor TaxID=1821036 RepID=UPI000D6E2E77|nr:DUF4625 domain-containing protein [Reichenbachiella versicolor]